jgi:hypothetical protein
MELNQAVTRKRLSLFAIWLFAAGISGPVGILLHEFGHYGVAVLSGVPQARLSFASASYQNSEKFWQTLANGDRVTAASIYSIQFAG